MGSRLAPVLANVILTEFEKTVVSNLLKDGTIKYYRKYVDDTLVLIKLTDIPTVLEKFNKFDKNLQFTVDTFPDGVVHFLDNRELKQAICLSTRTPTGSKSCRYRWRRIASTVLV